MATLSREQIEKMVSRFLQWRLPMNFNPDCGISFSPIANLGTSHEYMRTPVGANLLDATQAEEMIRYVVAPVLQYAQPEREEMNLEYIDTEIVWERHSELVQTIRCDQVGDETVMTKRDFMKACGEMSSLPIEAQPSVQGEAYCTCATRISTCELHGQTSASPEADLVEQLRQYIGTLNIYVSKGSINGPAQWQDVDAICKRIVAIARPEIERERDEKWEKAIRDTWHSKGWGSLAWLDALLEGCRYCLTPKVEDPAIEAVCELLQSKQSAYGDPNYFKPQAIEIVSAVRKADSGAAEALRKDVK